MPVEYKNCIKLQNCKLISYCILEGEKGLMVPGGDDDAFEDALRLGDLAGLTVSNEAEPHNYDVGVFDIENQNQKISK